MRSPVILIGIALTLAAMVLEFDRFEPRFLRAINQRSYDYLLKATYGPPVTDRVAIVDLDDESLKAYGQWPWPRYLVADLTHRLFEAGAAVVAYDIVFAEPDRTSPVNITRSLNRQFGLNTSFENLPAEAMDFDQLLATSFRDKKVVLGCYMHESDEREGYANKQTDAHYQGVFYTRGRGEAQRWLPYSREMLASHPVLTGAASSSGFFNTLPDPDGIVRGTPLAWAFGDDRIYPSLAVEALRLYLDLPQVGIEIDDGSIGVRSLRLGPYTIPTTSQGMLLINYRRGAFDPRRQRVVEFPEISACEVLDGHIAVKAIRDKIVLVGTSAAGLRDLRTTPVTEDYAGVRIHATVVDNILSKDFISRPTWMDTFDLAFLGFAGLMLTLIVHRWHAAPAFLLFAALSVIAVGVSLSMMQNWGLVYTPITSLLSLFGIYSVLTMVDYRQHERREKWIRDSFGAMVSNKVLRYMEENPSSLGLRGKRTEATIFFSDLVGFSTVAEKIDPERLSELINRYLTPMTDIVLERDGYLDKFIGDAIMAVWGIPTFNEEHAVLACGAALEQKEKLAELRPAILEEFGFDLRMRVGINTGEITAGNMGADRQFQYTAMGDAVNLAARLEPLNKLYQTEIMIGERTDAAVREHFETRLVDRVRVAGRKKIVHAYELLGAAGAVHPTLLQAYREYEKALLAFWDERRDDAAECLGACLSVLPEDGPALRLQELLASDKPASQLISAAR